MLLLQGPMGPFFHRLARDLRRHEAQVFKINFNGGDWLFYPRGCRNYRGTLEDWPGFLRDALTEWRIDVVMLYADCRPVHEAAIAVCEELGVDFHTFEEGYLRGDYITFEHGRTNAFSPLPRSPIAYLNEELPTPSSPPRKVGYAFRHQMLWAALYHISAFLLWPLLPPRTYHRAIGARELLPQARSFLRREIYRFREAGWQQRLTSDLSGRFFLVPLQVALDSQIICHSPYAESGVEAFIEEVVASFAQHAPRDTVLVFKHHPLDRGYNDYRRLLRRLARLHGLRDRLIYIHDQHLPTLLPHARGVVVINSTVGISALLEGRPVKVMGRAFYDMPGLAAQVGLDAFWRVAARHAPDMRLVERFHARLVHQNQINGNFYRRLPNTFCRCGLNWPLSREEEARHHARPAWGATRPRGGG